MVLTIINPFLCKLITNTYPLLVILPFHLGCYMIVFLNIKKLKFLDYPFLLFIWNYQFKELLFRKLFLGTFCLHIYYLSTKNIRSTFINMFFRWNLQLSFSEGTELKQKRFLFFRVIKDLYKKCIHSFTQFLLFSGPTLTDAILKGNNNKNNITITIHICNFHNFEYVTQKSLHFNFVLS